MKVCKNCSLELEDSFKSYYYHCPNCSIDLCEDCANEANGIEEGFEDEDDLIDDCDYEEEDVTFDTDELDMICPSCGTPLERVHVKPDFIKEDKINKSIFD